LNSFWAGNLRLPKRAWEDGGRCWRLLSQFRVSVWVLD